MKRAVDIYGSSQIPFKALHKAFDMQDRHMTGRRVELSVEYAQVQGSQAGGCEWKGYLKGYVSYSMKTLVVSKVLAFPPVKDVTKWIVWNETRWSEGIACINQFEVSTIE